MLPELGVPVHSRFEWLPERPRAAAQVREKWQPAAARWVALLPGARWENKRWPVENFQELARGLPAAADVKFVILGGADDSSLGRAITSANPAHCLDLTGKTSLPEMIEWLRLSHLTITNDTGPMHVAAALGKPVIALFGPTDPRSTGPYGQVRSVIQSRHLPCVPCMRATCTYEKPLACLREITPTTVSERALALLSKTTPA